MKRKRNAKLKKTVNINPSKILDFLNSLYGLPKIGVVFFFCIAFALWIHVLVKWVPWIPNYVSKIAVTCIVPFAGGFLLIGVSQWEKSTSPTVSAFFLTNFMFGFIAGTISALIYLTAGVKIIKKFKKENGIDNSDSDPPFPTSDSKFVKPPSS